MSHEYSAEKVFRQENMNFYLMIGFASLLIVGYGYYSYGSMEMATQAIFMSGFAYLGTLFGTRDEEDSIKGTRFMQAMRHFGWMLLTMLITAFLIEIGWFLHSLIMPMKFYV